MNRQPGFEKLYAKMHDIDPEDLVQYRFSSKDGYRLPQMASHYRLYCETLDSVYSDPVGWANSKDLEQDGYSHTFYVHSEQPGNGYVNGGMAVQLFQRVDQ